MNIERAKKCFKNHKATFTDYGNIKILDFKNPNSCEFRIRFMFEEDYCRLHISGDLGELIACNYNNMTYEKFARDFVNDTGYFEGKIQCISRKLYTYDIDDAEEDLKKYILERYETLEAFVGLELQPYSSYDEDEGIPKEVVEEELDVFFSEVLRDYDEDDNAHTLSQAGLDALNEHIYTEWEEVQEFGKRRSDILDWYMLAFSLAQEDLKVSV